MSEVNPKSGSQIGSEVKNEQEEELRVGLGQRKKCGYASDNKKLQDNKQKREARKR